MLNKLVNMAKQNFDLAFLIAEKYNLKDKLHKYLSKDNLLTENELKHYLSIKEGYNETLYSICYNLEKYQGYFLKNNLDFSDNCKLLDIRIVYSQIGKINIENNFLLKCLELSDSNLTNLDCSQNTNLTWLIIPKNNISSLDLRNNKKLEYICCEHNKLKYIDVSNNLQLNELNISNNRILKIDLSCNYNLKSLNCDSNSLKELDLSNLNLNNLRCLNNEKLKTIILKKGVKTKIKKDVHTKIIYK